MPDSERHAIRNVPREPVLAAHMLAKGQGVIDECRYQGAEKRSDYVIKE